MADECMCWSFIHMPHEVMAGIAWCLDVNDLCQAGACSSVLSEEVSDPELWFHLFMRTCWPPSDTLLAFAEECAENLAGIDWRARLRARMMSPAAIVVDVGRGYSKYTIVHGVRGRSEAEGEAPRIVQLCSSPSHPPDCDRGEQLLYIHSQIDLALEHAVQDLDDPLYAVALQGAELRTGGKAYVRNNSMAYAANNENFFRLIRYKTEDQEWEVEPLRSRNLRQRGYSNRSRSTSAAISVPAAELIAVRCASDLPLLVGEPFAQTVARRDGPIDSTDWARDICSQLQGRAGTLRIAPQAQMALWAHGIDHGIVVNIGQSHTIALPVVNGEVVSSASCSSNLGGASLTMFMMQVLRERLDIDDGGFMTWCRDLKEGYCYAAPPPSGGRATSLRARIATGDDFGIQRIPVDIPFRDGEQIELAEERVLVPELFFDRAMGVRPTLPELIASCAARVQQLGSCSVEGVQKLLQQVVLVGGGADIPGLRPRTEFEVRALLREGLFPELARSLTSTDEVFVLNPPLGNNGSLTSPRFVPVVGGCVRAACATHFKPPTSEGSQAKRHSIEMQIELGAAQQQFGRRLPIEWMQRRRFLLAGASVFRTGGGGGEDDDIWDFINGAMDSDPEDAGSQGSVPDSEDSSDGDDDDEELVSFGQPDDQCNSNRQQEEPLSQDQVANQEQPSSSSAVRSSPQREGNGANRSAGASKGNGKADRRGRTKGVQKGAFSARSKGGARGSGGPGSGAGGKARGKGRQRQVWRPVQRD